MKRLPYYIILLVIALFLAAYIDNSIRSDIRKWVRTQNCTVTDIERCFFCHGPYVIAGKNVSIYKVSTDCGRVFWVRKMVLFGDDVYEETSNGYKEIYADI